MPIPGPLRRQKLVPTRQIIRLLVILIGAAAPQHNPRVEIIFITQEPLPYILRCVMNNPALCSGRSANHCHVAVKRCEIVLDVCFRAAVVVINGVVVDIEYQVAAVFSGKH